MKTFQLKSVDFRRERTKSWRALEKLVAVAEKSGVHNLSAGEVRELATLYRAAVSSLSVARSISLDRNVVEYLESLTARAYFCVYGAKRNFWQTAWEFLAVEYPRLFRKHIIAIGLSAAFFWLGGVVGYVLVDNDTELYYSFVGEMASDRTPSATTEDLRATLYDRGGWIDELAQFASFLFSNNSQVAILCFTLGFLAGLPTFYLLFKNGLLLGAMTQLFHDRGLGPEWWAWILPHGVPELTAIWVSGGAGLVLAKALVFPGRRRRLDNLAQQGKEAGQLLLGCIVMMFVAALVEGFFRQLVQDIAIRYTLAILMTVGWAAYFALAGRPRRP